MSYLGQNSPKTTWQQGSEPPPEPGMELTAFPRPSPPSWKHLKTNSS